MDLSDALGGQDQQKLSAGMWPDGPSSGSGGPPGGHGMWPGPPSSGSGGPPGGHGMWPGPPSSGSGGPPGGQGMWPGPPSSGSGGPPGGQGMWPGPPSSGSGGPPGGHGMWPGPPSSGSGGPPGGHGMWPGPPSSGSGGPPGGHGMWPGPPSSGSGGPPGGHGMWPGPPSSGPGCPPGGQGMWPGPPASGPGGHPVAPQQNLSVPYNEKIPGGFQNNMRITIKGRIKAGADRIAVDLASGSDIAFHFNPRFNEGGRQVIVRNSRIGNKWGKEERDLCRFPFGEGRDFEMEILCSDSMYSVSVDRRPLLKYQHRIKDLRSVDRLAITRDLTLTQVEVSKSY
ncbi:galectin-3b isoform X2 [Synchiropus splendidus]|uniref:galectin-3b isoform X2 n=1 Tax=Synchiropus splendidus TaxID=270530 RepID=UPI00237ECB01|nr:galectin-3b isoform X2 [Synchiropus splendidus]